MILREIRLDIGDAEKVEPENFWFGAEDRLMITYPPARAGQALELTISSGDAGLYPYFPFLMRLACPGVVDEYLEFSEERQTRTAHLILPDTGVIDVDLWSEHAARPADVGIGRDQRTLSCYLVRATYAPARRFAPLGGFIGPTDRVRHRHFFHVNEPRPIFIIGSYRSATSAMSWAVGQHPNIWVIDETNIFPLLLGALRGVHSMGTVATKGFMRTNYIDRATFLQYFGATIDRMMKDASRDHLLANFLGATSGRTVLQDNFRMLRSRYSPKSRWVDATPENSTIGLGLAEMFPAAQFILMVRDPVAVAESAVNFRYVGGPAFELEESFQHWLRLTEAGLKLARVLGPERVMIVRHSDLVADAGACLTDIFDFLGEPRFEGAAATLSERANASSTRKDRVDEDQLATSVTPDLLARCRAVFASVQDDTWARMYDPARIVGDWNKFSRDLETRIAATVQ